MHSFGALKTATALGGALLRVRAPELLDRMRSIHASWPRQSRRDYLGRLCKYAMIAGLTRPLPYGAVARACELMGRDFDQLVDSAARTFSTGPDLALLARLERRPCAGLLSLMARRVRRFDEGRLRARAAAGERLARSLAGAMDHPGEAAAGRTHWLFPVVAPDADELIRALRSAGFDAARGTSSLVAVPAPADRPDAEPLEAGRMVANMVFLPAYPELGERGLRRLVAATLEACRSGDAMPATDRPRYP
jgi:dTDP-4-amino-4,6-dideoxygalactose transaminase